MSDIADDADRHVEYFIQESLQKLKRAALRPRGLCHYCDDDVTNGALFCSVDCRDEHDREARIKQIAGK